jgi:hypothetical protein
VLPDFVLAEAVLDTFVTILRAILILWEAPLDLEE